MATAIHPQLQPSATGSLTKAGRLAFQPSTWDAYLGGHSGLIQVLRFRKTFAAVMGPIARMLSEDPVPQGSVCCISRCEP